MKDNRAISILIDLLKSVKDVFNRLGNVEQARRYHDFVKFYLDDLYQRNPLHVENSIDVALWYFDNANFHFASGDFPEADKNIKEYINRMNRVLMIDPSNESVKKGIGIGNVMLESIIIMRDAMSAN